MKPGEIKRPYRPARAASRLGRSAGLRRHSPGSARSASSSDSVPESRSSTCNKQTLPQTPDLLLVRVVGHTASAGRGQGYRARRPVRARRAGPGRAAPARAGARRPAAGARSASLFSREAAIFWWRCDLHVVKPARADTHLLGNALLIQRMRSQLVSQEFEHY